VAAQAQQLGAAGLVRAIERLGSALVDMRHAPDPRILVEVALVQLTHDETASDVDALLARIERLEQSVKQLRAGGPGATGGSAAPKDPATGRAVLGGAARRPSPSPTPTTGSDETAADTTSAAAPTAPADAPTPAAEPVQQPAAPLSATPDPQPAQAAAAAPATPAAPAAAPTMSVMDAWEGIVKSQVKPLVRALFSAGSFLGNTGDTWQFGIPNEAHGAKCNEHRPAVEAALSQAVGGPVTIEFVVSGRHRDEHAVAPRSATPAPKPDPTPAAAPVPAPTPAANVVDDRSPEPPPAAEPEPPAYEPPPDHEVDLHDLTDAPPETVKTPIDRLAEAFPGSELINDD